MRSQRGATEVHFQEDEHTMPYIAVYDNHLKSGSQEEMESDPRNMHIRMYAALLRSGPIRENLASVGSSSRKRRGKVIQLATGLSFFGSKNVGFVGHIEL